MKQAPSFTLPNTQGEDISLPEKGIVVLYFYPKANTPGCTIEAKKFSELYPQFVEAGALVIGISPDPHNKVCKFSEKYDFNHVMLADEEHEVCESYGVWKQKSMFGKKYMGVERTSFLIQDGKIIKEYKHKPGKTEEEILTDIQELHADETGN